MALLDLFRGPILSDADRARIMEAVRDAERGHRGEIRVHVERRCPDGEPLKRAESLFAALGMNETEGGTAALLYVATDDRVACVWAGAGLFGARAPGFWDDVVEEVAGGFLSNAPARGIRVAVGRLGKLLAEVAPGDDRGGNELTDDVSG